MKDARAHGPTWVPPAATAALNEAWNIPGLTPGDRAVLRRLAADRAMHEVWLKLPRTPARGAGWVVRSALWYAMPRVFELRYPELSPEVSEDPKPDGPKPTFGAVKSSARQLVQVMQAAAQWRFAEETWTNVRGDDCALDFKAVLAVVEKLPQFLELLSQPRADMFDTLPTVALPSSKRARQKFFCKGMERQLRWLYDKPLYVVIAILAQVVFALPQALDPGTVKQMCKRP
jgi:hypothetical protein